MSAKTIKAESTQIDNNVVSLLTQQYCKIILTHQHRLHVIQNNQPGNKLKPTQE